MKALCINGSPRKNGSTAYIINKISEGMRENNIEVNIYCLGDMNIKFCTGCKNCYKTGRCVHNDDINLIIEQLITSDLVLIASPSYWGDVTGQLKVFFDRNTPFCDTNPNNNKINIPHGKKGISISIRAGQSERENTHIIETIEHYYGHLGISPFERISITGIDKIEDLMNKQKEIEKAYELGKNIKNRM